MKPSEAREMQSKPRTMSTMPIANTPFCSKKKFAQEQDQTRKAHLAVRVARTVPASIALIEVVHVDHCYSVSNSKAGAQFCLPTFVCGRLYFSTDRHLEFTQRVRESGQITQKVVCGAAINFAECKDGITRAARRKWAMRITGEV